MELLSVTALFGHSAAQALPVAAVGAACNMHERLRCATGGAQGRVQDSYRQVHQCVVFARLLVLFCWCCWNGLLLARSYQASMGQFGAQHSVPTCHCMSSDAHVGDCGWCRQVLG